VLNGRHVSEADAEAGDAIDVGSRRLLVMRMQAFMRASSGDPELVHYSSGSPVARSPLEGTVVVGRQPDSDLVIDDPRVSRRHVEVRPSNSGAMVIDLAPNNSLRVNGRVVAGECLISVGDRIQLGGADEVLALELPSSTAGPVEVEVAEPGLARTRGIEVDAGGETSVEEVAKTLAGLLELSGDPTLVWTLARPDTGELLNPRNRWADAGVQRGDLLALLQVAEPITTETQFVGNGAARTVVSQLPRAVVPPLPHRIRAPRAPQSQSFKGRGIIWQIAGGGAMVLAAILIAVLMRERGGMFAIFALVGAVVGVVSILAGILGEQSRRRHSVRRFEQLLNELDEELLGVCRDQAARLREVSPASEVLAAWAKDRGRRLWERRADHADFLRLRVGVGSVASLIEIEGGFDYEDAHDADRVQEVLGRHRELPDVPILLPPTSEASVIGVVGDRGPVLDLASGLVIQAATLHAPSELQIAVPATNRDWMWARWLPHVERASGVDLTWDEGGAAQLRRRLRSELGQSQDRHDAVGHGPSRLIVVPHGAAEAVTEFLADAVHPRHLVLVLADRESDLPVRVDAVIDVTGGTATMQGPAEYLPLGLFRPDAIQHADAAAIARQLAHFMDARQPSRRASGQLGLLDLIGVNAPDQVDVTRLWSARPRAPLSAVVGTTLDGDALVVGFRSDGVHGVVGGTTGSGKSEFLQTLLTSLALGHAPDQLVFFLIDFKGGAAFTALADLPHVVGVVTDLEQDASLANRAFTALEAEMSRRKRILEEARVPGLIEYEQTRQSESMPLPALLVVIDEFALLVRQQPEVKDRLDLVATQGRSLGVHLLLATQSPSNVITPSIRGNTQVWLSLRVVDESESVELLGQRDAARIPSDRPGRGYVRFGGGDTITGFQTARIARAAGAVEPALSIRPFADDPLPASRLPDPRPSSSRDRAVTELELVVNRIVNQCRQLGIRSADPLWLPPLPEWLDAPTSPDGLIREPGHLTVLVGLRDDPAHQRQEPWSVDLGDVGNLLVLGARGAGKSTTLHQVTLDLAEQHAPAALHLYGVDSGTGSLNILEKLPHCGGVVGAADTERLYRLFARLTRMMEARRDELAASGHRSFSAWRRATPIPDPWVLVAVDDYTMFKETAEGTGAGLLSDQFLSLVQGGPAVGIHFVVSSGQAGDMRLNLANLFGSRILLRQVDVADYAMLDLRLRPEEVPPAHPGRALVAGGYEVQVFVTPDSRVEDITALWSSDIAGPTPVGRLPTEIRLRDLEGGKANRAYIGVGGDELEPLELDIMGGEPHVVVAGEGRSGRSTALVSALQAIREVEPSVRSVVLAPRPSPVRQLSEWTGVDVASSPDDMMEALRHVALGSNHQTVLIVDDAESLPNEAGDLLEGVLRDGPQWGLRSVIAGRVSDLGRSFDGWVRYLLSLRSGLLLMPAPDSGHLLDVRLPVVHAPMCPGRGFLCRHGVATLVQVGLPDPEDRST
jgi:DNA segregation ATPase FtsK/SpoIIIE, S-DNA-T family